jgi:hypothetical protein
VEDLLEIPVGDARNDEIGVQADVDSITVKLRGDTDRVRRSARWPFCASPRPRRLPASAA